MNRLIDELKRDLQLQECLTRWEIIEERNGQYADFPQDLHPQLKSSLLKKGIDKLYTHQRSSYDVLRRGDNLVVVTPTASGKTLCYNLSVLQSLMEDPEARALYLFPTKALSQDQQSALNEVVLPGDLPVKVMTYDGDTPSSLRIAARESGRIVVTNPDMLHSGILPNHPKWIAFLKSLKYIVIDEVHTYRGVFGSHMTNLLRRLKRILSFYGTKPTFVLLSATIGNPKELAEQLLEEELVLIDENGAPSGEKNVLLYNPPLVDSVQGIRRGVVLEAQKWAVRFLKDGVKTIVFAKSRVRTELIRSYINQNLENHFNENQKIKVESYRGGYLPGERRAIEKGLRDGSIHGVVSTNALELGIDIGGLDAAILAGLPTSVASAWQQAGRAGRSSAKSLGLFIASSSPRDQYLVRHPEYFLGRSPESAFVDPDNPYILMDHLKCAAFELPFLQGESFGGDVSELLEYLESEGTLRLTKGSYYWSDRGYPSEGISLRSITAENVIIIDETKGRHAVIGEMDKSSAKELLFDKAIYIHRGRQYVVKKLDLENLQCFIEESFVNYYTDAVVKTDIKVLTEDSTWDSEALKGVDGDVLVRRNVAKFKKLRYNTHENIGYGEIYLPEDEMHTRGSVLVFDDSTILGSRLMELPENEQGGLLGRLGSILIHTLPLFLLCSPGDIRIAERVRDPHFGAPALYFYDAYPGGVGLSDQVHNKIGAIVAAALEQVGSCGCSEGCPSCVGPIDEKDVHEVNYKAKTKEILKLWSIHG